MTSTPPAQSPAIPERFWSKVARGEADECWLWTRALSTTGYGVTRAVADGRSGTTSAHRVAWMLDSGRPIAAGMVIDHLCNVRACCNPAHLELVTQTENVRRSSVYRAGEGKVSHMVGHITLRPRGKKVMAIWRERLETGMTRQRGKTFNTEAEALEWSVDVSTLGAL